MLPFSTANHGLLYCSKSIFCSHANTVSYLATIVAKDEIISLLCGIGWEKYDKSATKECIAPSLVMTVLLT